MRNYDRTPVPVESTWPAWAGRWLSRVQLEVCRDLARLPRGRGDVDCGEPTLRALTRRGLVEQVRTWAKSRVETPSLTDAGRAVVAAYEAGRARGRELSQRLVAENRSLRTQLANLEAERDALAEHIESVTDPDGMPLGQGVDS